MSTTRPNPFAVGSAFAFAAAILFGATMPFVKRFGEGVGPFATATVLYAGATLGMGLPRHREDEPSVAKRHVPRLAVVALLGAAMAPACLAWGLQHAGALVASLLLNLEAVFTVGLARALYREPIGRRVAVASTLMVAGGSLLVFRRATVGEGNLLGVVAVVAATLAWALDNALTRPLADLDSRAVVFWKDLVGAGMSAAAALAMRDRWPAAASIAGLLACGALGYGLSLRLYLHAQRLLGAARTGSLFAFGPFAGALVALALGDRSGGIFVAAASACFVGAVLLHATERHAHRHRHRPLTHEHTHVHDDEHHTHAHEPPVVGAHSHLHAHEPTEHEHPHASDVHHLHEHA